MTGPVLPALPNLRDVGGAGGVPVVPGVLWRSDDPALLDADEARAVAGLGIGLVLDLRDEDLVRRRPRHALAEIGVERVWLPMSGWAPGDTLEGAGPPRDMDLLTEYVGYLEHGAGAYAEALRRLADASTPALVHCAAGKDRTGVLVALVLRIAGVDDEAIVADYAQTAERMPAMLARWRRLNPQLDQALATMGTGFLASRPETMRALLAEIDRRYGGAAAWALSKGVEQDVLVRLRARLVPAGQ